MDPAKGYRLKVTGVADLSRVLGGFRADAMRLLARRYGALVAREATWTHDRWKLGLSPRQDDFIASACAAVRRRLGDEGPVPYSDVNCVLSVHFVHDAVLAGFVHGDDAYRKAWESIREVVSWGWSETGPRPRGITEAAWEARARYWKAALSGPPLGQGLKFTLIETGLPDLGWGSVRRYMPSWEERIARASTALGRRMDSAEALRRAEEGLDRDLARDGLVPGPARLPGTPPVRNVPSRLSARPREKASAVQGEAREAAAPQKDPAAEDEASAAERIRREAREARKARSATRRQGADPDRAASIDHADVVVASDGRVFVAAPYVGLDTETRVFLQVGDRHVAVSQGGLQYGHVTDVPKTAIDLLRTCKTVILVEVARKADGGRLLRARHVAIVSDIGLNDSLSISLGGYKRQAGARGDKEIREWESGQ